MTSFVSTQLGRINETAFDGRGYLDVGEASSDEEDDEEEMMFYDAATAGVKHDEFFVPEFEHDQKSGAARAASAATATLHTLVQEKRVKDGRGNNVKVAEAAHSARSDEPRSANGGNGNGVSSGAGKEKKKKKMEKKKKMKKKGKPGGEKKKEKKEARIVARIGQGTSTRSVGRSNTLAQPDELTFEQFAMRYFSETSEGKCAHQKTQLHAPLLKRVWGDGDSHRVLVVWSALVIFLGDVKLKKKEYTINADEHGDGRTAKPIKVVVTNLDAIRIILSTGLKRESARDEIYCQICKQLVNNPNSHSHARAWIMLALCAGVFCPSPTFEKVLHNFIKERAPPGYLPYLLQRFARAEMAFQPRQHPASSVEVHSAFTGKKSQVQVHVYFKVSRCLQMVQRLLRK